MRSIFKNTTEMDYCNYRHAAIHTRTDIIDILSTQHSFGREYQQKVRGNQILAYM